MPSPLRSLGSPALIVVLLCSACSSGSGASGRVAAPPASPRSPAEPTPPGPAGGESDLASARALPAGPPISFTVGCAANFFVGPFDLERSGETVPLVGTSRSLDGSQVCAPTAEWVDRAGTFVSVAGFGCAEGAEVTTSELTYEYSPDNGGNAANPVYLHVRREDPPGCTSAEITLARR